MSKKYILSVESCLDWDDSENQFNVLGVFENEDDLIELVDSKLWEYEGQDESTEDVVKVILESIDYEDDEWGISVFVEPEEYAGGYPKRFTFHLNLA